MTLILFIIASDAPKWWDYPGAELWKFFNLALFVGLMVWVLIRFNIGNAFKTRGESIRNELEKARTERDAALAKLKEVEERIAGMNEQLSAIKERSRIEAADEQKRIAQTTQEEISKLSTQAQREIEHAGKAAKNDLRKFAAEQSVRMAEDLIKRDMRPEDDARLMTSRVEEMGAAR